ncbi:LysR family transcriptional regulator OxyR [Acinetobacter johnsonii]|jgi:LysR family hydrogen peroxide-inducible transcriptional activator|uniref:Hydrogen peroxide-inducible activator n=1 Tax=Acinetobacter johnsonii TaxID=40214 RepID=A0A1R7Q8I4_ACIJO|nr:MULTISPECIES: LysR family transcriptional regulator OxyR [Acinetobacter]AZN63484.1 LysR family transcriptional regulator [Acinetobacter johnsonii]MBB4810169.1 LysR family hydrogen peroxide-inducible transcriptional activator [Acinetobacter johnsonii]MDH0656493.1 LysR family transcriptional regulator OxyR [Acinetobacter johnsonii]QKY90165.1 LysR family transcriptional regulator [Acinetobacter sp. NEB 394]SJX20557.1 Hydrogen peroxide-inducible activator [Acinetobacter johnsonii]
MAALPSLRQLSYLVTLSETLHFTEAARRSFVTQSTLSGGIMELERLLGGVLVERDRQNVRLTPLGEQVVARARVLLADAQDLMRLSREMSEPLTGDLHLGVIPTIAPFILAQLLDEVHKQLPKIQLHLHEAQSEKIVEKLEHGNLDMVVLALPFDTRGLKVAEVAKESLFLVCNKSDIASQAKSLDDLDLSRLMLLEEGHCLRDHTLSACPIGERKNDHRLKASSLPTLVEMVSADLGFTLLPEIAIHTNMIKANPELMVKQIEAAPSRILALVTRKSTPLQSEFDVLLQILQKITQNLH